MSIRWLGSLMAISAVALVGATQDTAHSTFSALGTQMTILVSSAQTNGTSATLRIVVPPGGGPPAAHVHSREDETFIVMSGHFRFWHGEKVEDGLPGSVLYLPRNEPHQFLNVGKTPGELIVTIVPGNFVNFFVEVAKRGITMPKDKAEFDRLSTDYGIRYVPSLAPTPTAK